MRKSTTLQFLTIWRQCGGGHLITTFIYQAYTGDLITVGLMWSRSGFKAYTYPHIIVNIKKLLNTLNSMFIQASHGPVCKKKGNGVGCVSQGAMENIIAVKMWPKIILLFFECFSKHRNIFKFTGVCTDFKWITLSLTQMKCTHCPSFMRHLLLYFLTWLVLCEALITWEMTHEWPSNVNFLVYS